MTDEQLRLRVRDALITHYGNGNSCFAAFDAAMEELDVYRKHFGPVPVQAAKTDAEPVYSDVTAAFVDERIARAVERLRLAIAGTGFIRAWLPSRDIDEPHLHASQIVRAALAEVPK